MTIPAAALAALTAACTALAPRELAPRPRGVGAGVRFAYYAPQARRVQLGGDWPGNAWTRGDGRAGETDIGLMHDDDGDGLWEIVVALPPGRYRYAFLVDETVWRIDPANPDEVPGGPAGVASQIVVVRRGKHLEVQ